MPPDNAFLDAPMAPPPIFVGGTGRSGTTVVGQLIGQHSAYHFIPIETRFHVAPRGLLDVISADVSTDEFAERMLGSFFARKGPGGGDRGLQHITDADKVDTAAALFVKEFPADRYAAARRLVRRLLDPLAEANGKRAWVEMTPGNVSAASKLVRIFPEAKIVHTVRDGRDVASSVMSKDWGPSNIVDGIFWWSERLRDAEAQSRMIDDRSIHVVRFDELIYGRRQTALKLLLRYLDLEPEPAVVEFFQTMTRGKAHLGRWRRDLSDAEADEISELYRGVFEELRNDGLSCLPLDPSADPATDHADSDG